MVTLVKIVQNIISGLLISNLKPPSKMSTSSKGRGILKRKSSNKELSPLGPSPAKQRIVVTPWRDTTEFNTVFEWLFSKQSTPAQCRQALSKMRIWQLRRGSLCPAAVLATGVLVEAQLEDKQGNSQIQTSYASAFTRFYNFMSSIIQGHNMASMYETARELGLESFIVDLRHLCAHGQELPPVEVMRKTTEHCLDWLKQYYWLPHKETMLNLEAKKLPRKDKLKFEQEMKQLSELYDLTLECQIKGADKLKSMAKLKTSGEFNKIRVYASRKKVKTSKEIKEALINDLGLIVKKEAAAMKDLKDIYVGSLIKMPFFLTAGLEFKDKEDEVIEAAQELFRMWAMQGYIENVFVEFIQMAEDSNEIEPRRLGASYWACKMIETFKMLSRMKKMYKEELELNDKFKPTDFSSLNKPVMSKTMRNLLIHSGVDVSLTLVFGENPKKPRTWVFDMEFILQRVTAMSKYSAEILKGLLPLVEPPFSPGQLKDLIELCNIRLQSTEKELEKSRADSLSPTECNLDNLEKLLGNLEPNETINYVSSEGSEFGLWKLETDHNWSKCALGVLPWA